MTTFDGLLSANEFLVSCESETVYGDDPFDQDPANISDFTLFEEFTITPATGEAADETVRAVHSAYAGMKYGDQCSISWTKPLTGKLDAAGDPPFWAPLLKSSNFEETINATTDVEYSPVTGLNMNRVPSVAYALFTPEQERENARLHKVLGCRGNRTLNFEMGQVARISGEDTGLYAPFPDSTITIPDNPTSYEGDKKPLLVVGMSVEIGGDTYAVESASFETNWSVEVDQDATTPGQLTSHVHLVRSRGEAMGGELALKGRSATLNNIVSKIDQGTTFPFTITLSDGTDTFAVEMPAIQFGDYSDNKSGHYHFGVPYQAFATGDGENEAKLVFS